MSAALACLHGAAPACYHPKGNPLFHTPERFPDIPHARCQMHVFFKQSCAAVRDEMQTRINASALLPESTDTIPPGGRRGEWRAPHTNGRYVLKAHVDDRGTMNTIDAEVHYDSQTAIPTDSAKNDLATKAWHESMDINATKTAIAARKEWDSERKGKPMIGWIGHERSTPIADTIGPGPMKKDVIDMGFVKLGKEKEFNPKDALLPLEFDGGCQVNMCSVSWYTSDPMSDWVNYCNLHALYCGEGEGCKMMQSGELDFLETGLGESCLMGSTRHHYERSCASDSDKPRNAKPGDPLNNPMMPQTEPRAAAEFGRMFRPSAGIAHHVPGSDPETDDPVPAAEPVTNIPGYGTNSPDTEHLPIHGDVRGMVGGETIASKGVLDKPGVDRSGGGDLTGSMPDIFKRFERNPIRPDPQGVKYANAPQTPVYDPKYAAGPRMSVGTIGDVQLAINATSNGTDDDGRATPENKSLFEPYRTRT